MKNEVEEALQALEQSSSLCKEINTSFDKVLETLDRHGAIEENMIRLNLSLLREIDDIISEQ